MKFYCKDFFQPKLLLKTLSALNEHNIILRDIQDNGKASLSFVPHSKKLYLFWNQLNFQRTFSEAVAQRSFVKKVSLELSQNSQENTFARVSFLKEHLR